MNRTLRRIADRRLWPVILIAFPVLLLALFLGKRASSRDLVLLIALAGTLVMFQRPRLGLFALVAAALVVPLEFGTGTQVSLNTAVLIVPALLAVWALDMVRRREVRPAPSPANRPLLLFIGAAMLSLVAGNALWDPAVPRPSNLLVVQEKHLP